MGKRIAQYYAKLDRVHGIYVWANYLQLTKTVTVLDSWKAILFLEPDNHDIISSLEHFSGDVYWITPLF